MWREKSGEMGVNGGKIGYNGMVNCPCGSFRSSLCYSPCIDVPLLLFFAFCLFHLTMHDVHIFEGVHYIMHNFIRDKDGIECPPVY